MADDIVETGEAADFSTQIAGFFFPFEIFRNFADGNAQLLNEIVVLDDVAVGAFVRCGDGCFKRRDTSDENEVGVWCNLASESKQFDTSGTRHTHIGDDDIE